MAKRKNQPQPKFDPERQAALSDLFIRGETSRLVATPLTEFEAAGSLEILVGSLVLSGDLERALAIGVPLEERDASGMIPFYLSLGLTRSGRYQEAEERMARLDHLRPEGLVGFYREQARGFYGFVLGDPTESAHRARSALAAAEAAAHPLRPLARTLSLDLLGHSLVQVGQMRSGIKTLKLAREAAGYARHENFQHAISVSLLKYEALFGLEHSRIVARLYRALIELKPNDSYSRSELRLELSRQQILRGQLREARRHLEDAAAEILGSRNRHQTASLHLRIAWMARLEGRESDAILGLQSAEMGLESENDRELRTKLRLFRLELMQSVERATGHRQKTVELQAALDSDRATEKLVGIEKRMVQRKFGPAVVIEKRTGLGSEGEDPFGDLMDRVHSRAVGVEDELLSRRYFGLLVPMLGLNLGQTAIVLGAPRGAVLVVDRGETRLSEVGLRGLLGKLIVRLADGSCTRQEAIEMIWGYRYEAERHDRLLAVAVSRIRKALGGLNSWVELHGDRLVMQDQVVVRFWSDSFSAWTTGTPWTQKGSNKPPGLVAIRPVALRAAPYQQTDEVSNANFRRLRIRQLQVLEDLATRGDVGVQDLVERFGISRASALRDLNELVDLRFVIRVGETRATRYMLGGEGIER